MRSASVSTCSREPRESRESRRWLSRPSPRPSPRLRLRPPRRRRRLRERPPPFPRDCPSPLRWSRCPSRPEPPSRPDPPSRSESRLRSTPRSSSRSPASPSSPRGAANARPGGGGIDGRPSRGRSGNSPGVRSPSPNSFVMSKTFPVAANPRRMRQFAVPWRGAHFSPCARTLVRMSKLVAGWWPDSGLKPTDGGSAPLPCHEAPSSSRDLPGRTPKHLEASRGVA